jgi:co-chaperonin GroES (HSP10)
MIIPALHRILIKQDKLEESNKDYLKMKQMGLVLPDMDDKKRAQASVDTGTVVAIGATAFRDFGADPDTHEEFVLLNDEDLCCVFKS